MRRIGIDYTSAVRQRAGIGRYTRGLVRALAELDHSSSYVLFSAGRDSQADPWPPNFRRCQLPLRDDHLALLWQRLRLPIPVEWAIGRVDPFYSPDFVLPPTRARRKVLTIHDLSFMRCPTCSSPALLSYLMDAVPRSVQKADVILADSISTSRDLVELLGVPPERVSVVYPGVEPWFVPQIDELKLHQVLSRYKIQHPFLLGLGTLQPRKNFSRLIRAFDHLRRQYRVPHHLVIGGGKGWLYDEIDETIEALDLHTRVQMIGFVPDEDLAALYSAADLFVFPSLYEGFGIPVLESMACGTPVVTSTVSSLPEVAGDAALAVWPEDVEALAHAMWRLIDDEGLRSDLRQRGFEQVKRFTWRRAGQTVVDLFASVS